jgi:hypothetical protein
MVAKKPMKKVTPTPKKAAQEAILRCHFAKYAH